MRYKLYRKESLKHKFIKHVDSFLICGATVLMLSPKLSFLMKQFKKVSVSVNPSYSYSNDIDEEHLTKKDILKYAETHFEEDRNDETIIDKIKEKLCDAVDDVNDYVGITRDQILSYAENYRNKDLTIESLSLENRLATNSPQTYFSLSTNLGWLNYINRNTYDWFIKYGEMYGVDPYFLMAEGNQETRLNHEESLPGGKYYNGFAVGIFQFETPNKFSRNITAYNYKTGQNDTIHLDMNTAANEETNIQMAAMEMANHIKRYHGNIMLAFQANNYGIYMVDKIINIYASQMNETPEQAMENYDEVGWLELVNDLHVHPRKYTSSWQYKTYGDGNYMNHVLQFFPGDKTYFMYNGKVNIFSFSQLKMLHTYEYGNENNLETTR